VSLISSSRLTFSVTIARHSLVRGGPSLSFGVSGPYRDTLLIRNSAPLGPYSRTMPRALWWSQGGGLFHMSEVPLYYADHSRSAQSHIPLRM
jgi:hypothetical protein